MNTVIQKANRFGRVTIFLLLALGSFSAWGAGSEPISATDGSTVLQNDQTDRAHPAYHDFALLIAGLSQPESPLAANENNPAWVKHAKFIDQSWESFATGRLARMREWASQELSSATSTTVFYPFSGPDFINVFTLFPHAKTYLMVALEPVGEIPDFSGLDGKNFFARLQRSLYDLLYLDFFITAKMATCLGKDELKGVLPVLLFFLAREQARVLDVQYWVMTPDGSIEELPAAGPGNRPGGIPGVRIVFESPGSAGNQTLYYFQLNLRNDSLERNQPFVSFLKSFGPMTTFTKAASYLMFKPHFSAIRQFILDRSQDVLQDDSAIPLKHFDPSVWNLRFYGTCANPIPRFRNCYQADMADIYKKGQDIQPLPFGIGYHHRVHTSNLMFASKKVKELAGDSN